MLQSIACKQAPSLFGYNGVSDDDIDQFIER